MVRYFITAVLVSCILTIGCDKESGTGPNNPPYAPSSPSPPNGATDQPTDVDFSWTGGDPDGDPVTYEVYLGTKSSPPQVASGLTGIAYDPGLLNWSSTYYWRIVSKDDRGGETAGPVWSFTTEAGTGNGNSVEVESVYVSTGSTVSVRVFFENSRELGALTVPLEYTSDAVVVDSGSFVGSRIEYLSTKDATIQLAERRILVYGIPITESYVPPGSGLLCTIYFTIPGPANTVVTINSTFIPPSTSLQFVDSQANPFTPRFVPGKIVVETQ